MARLGVARLASRTLLLLTAEFGAAELLDTFVWRPALMMAAVVLLDEPVWGLLAGKAAADVLFYVVSALGYRVTELTGIRRRRPRRPRSAASLVKRYLICEIECRYDRHRHLPRADRLADPRRAPPQGAHAVRAGALARDEPERSRPHRAGPAEPQPGDSRPDRESLDSEFVSLGHSGPQHLRIVGGQKLHGAIDVKTSKNAAVALLCASLLNRGRTTLRNLARIEEVNRILEVLHSLGVRTSLDPRQQRPRGDPADPARPRRHRRRGGPPDPDGDHVPRAAPARPPVVPAPVCRWLRPGTRTVEHLASLRHFGLDVVATHGFYEATSDPTRRPTRPIVLTERGDTVTENAPRRRAARWRDGDPQRQPELHGPGPCFFLERLGVRIEGIGSTTLTVHGLDVIDVDVEYSPSEDPIEAMSLMAAAVVTGSEITIRRVPIEFMEIELATLEGMGMEYATSDEYRSANGQTRLVDLTTVPDRCTHRSTRSTRCRSRASTSTTCRSPSSARSRRARH